MSDVGGPSKREKKVVVCRTIIYSTKMIIM
jgi:hypothetical protein